MTSSMSGFGGMGGGGGFKDNTGAGIRGGSTGDIIPKGYRKGQLQQFTPEMMELFQQLFSHVSPDSYLSKLAGGDEETFNQIEAPAHRQFSELLGGLGSRFSGMGSTGARKSSGFQNTGAAAASNFAQDLQSQRQGLQRQALMDLMGISSSLLGQRPNDQFLVEKQQKPQTGGFGGAASGALRGGLAGSTFGPLGSLAGGVLGGVGGYFS